MELEINGQDLEDSEEDVVITLVAVADDSINEKFLADWLSKVCK